MEDSVAGIHPLNTTGMYHGIVSGAVKVLILTMEDIGQCGDAPVRMRAGAFFIDLCLDSWNDMIQEYEGTGCVSVPVCQHAVYDQVADICSLSLGGKTAFLFHIVDRYWAGL